MSMSIGKVCYNLQSEIMPSHLDFKGQLMDIPRDIPYHKYLNVDHASTRDCSFRWISIRMRAHSNIVCILWKLKDKWCHSFEWKPIYKFNYIDNAISQMDVEHFAMPPLNSFRKNFDYRQSVLKLWQLHIKYQTVVGFGFSRFRCFSFASLLFFSFHQFAQRFPPFHIARMPRYITIIVAQGQSTRDKRLMYAWSLKWKFCMNYPKFVRCFWCLAWMVILLLVHFVGRLLVFAICLYDEYIFVRVSIEDHIWRWREKERGSARENEKKKIPEDNNRSESNMGKVRNRVYYFPSVI